MRVFAATLGTETNTFSPLPTGLSGFREHDYFPAGKHPDRMQAFAGPLWAARERAAREEWTLIEGMVAFAMPGGITTRAAYEALRDELLADLHGALPVDVVLLGLHGAMVAEGYDDCEGDLLARARALAGPRAVIGAELDPHCHLSEAMLEHADILVCFKEYPHSDILERAHELVDLCAARAAGRTRPVMSVHDCRMISTYHTMREPMKSFVARIKELEGREGVLSVSVAHGFPWGDVPDMGTKILVITDDRAAHGLALAQQLGRELTGIRDQTQPEQTDLDTALDHALAVEGGPVVLADSADNAGGGAPSDSTFVLRRLLERNIGNAVLGPLWDPGAVRIAIDAGENAIIPLRIGGKTGPTSGAPVDALVSVRRLMKEARMTGLSGTPAFLGDCALVETGGVRIVLTTIRNQALGTDLFTQFGVDLSALKLIVVKSSQHFYAQFGPIARQVLYADTPGTLASDLKTLPYRKIRRPMWPLDA
jgi:microcystin degradation protein MlrC